MSAMRAAAGVLGAALLLVGGAGAGTLAVGGEPLGRLLPEGTVARFVEDDGGGVTVTAAAGTPVLALGQGRLEAGGQQTLALRGDGEDAGLLVTYRGVAAPSAAGPVKAGAAIAAVPASASIDVSATVDGQAIDLGPRLADDGDGAAGTATAEESSGAAGYWHRPVDGAVISQLFGCTDFIAEPVDQRCPSGHFHSGIDLAAPAGTAVHAALAGRVHVVRTIGGYGLRVELTHARGMLTLYGHLESTTVVDGDSVDTGEVIGLVGTTGNSTGPHLHFEVRRGGIPEDPRIDVPLP